MIYTVVNTSTNIKYELIFFKFDYTLLFLSVLYVLLTTLCIVASVGQSSRKGHTLPTDTVSLLSMPFGRAPFQSDCKGTSKDWDKRKTDPTEPVS
jgi:hypothetical protein